MAWKDICKPKAEGGLGIRLLEDFQLVFRLKHIWNFFTNSTSLWVAWLKQHIFKRKSFWLTEDSQRFSATIRSMLQLKDMLYDLMRCQIMDGKSAYFWFDSWTEQGPLIALAGEEGPRSLRIRKDAHVIDASTDGSWRMPAARTQQLVMLGCHCHSTSGPLKWV